MKTSIYLYITISLIFFSCKNSNTAKINIEEAETISQITTNYDTLIDKVKNKGDIDAYNELYYGFLDSGNSDGIDSVLVYSKIMAKKYNCKIAYLHYFNSICKKNRIDPYNDYSKINLKKLDYTSKSEAIFCLEKMLENKTINKDDFNKVIK